MTVLDMAAYQRECGNTVNFDARGAMKTLRRLELVQQAYFISALTLEQAQELLSELPFRHVQDILEQLENSGHELRARELSAAFGIMISASGNTQDYLEAGVLEHVKARLGWIVSLSLLGIVSGMIVAEYEDALSALIILAIYMPMMADTGGNVGSQAATLLVRSLAIGEVAVRDWARVLWTEFRVAMIMATALVAVIMVRVLFLGGNAELPAGITLVQVGIAVSMAMVIQVISSSLFGAMLPFMAKSLRLDPAVLVSPVLTSVVDMSGMLIYFYVTTKVLGL